MDDLINYKTDVLVIGGGPAGAWAAYSAVQNGARVILADKGYMSTSGAMAIATTGMVKNINEFYTAFERGGLMAWPAWQKRIFDETQNQDLKFSEWHDLYAKNYLQGLEIMQLFRRKLLRKEVIILDHSPILQLGIGETDGFVRGALGFNIKNQSYFSISSSSVIIATGGCGWKSGTFGCNTNTGDGLLMAEEAGAKLTSMEFGSFYALAPKNTTVTKGYYYKLYASFRDQDRKEIPVDGLSYHPTPFFCRFDRATDRDRILMKLQQPNLFLTFDKMGINPFEDWWEVDFIQEGTMRTGGGILINNIETCSTGLPGLYSAGDAACRTPIIGATLISESYVTWAVSSGKIAGKNAAIYAKENPSKNKKLYYLGSAGINQDNKFDEKQLTIQVQKEFLPRFGPMTSDKVSSRYNRIENLWGQVKNASGSDPIKSRETASMIHVGKRVSFGQSLRKESRGTFFRHNDYPTSDQNQLYYISQFGLDNNFVSYDRNSF